MHFFPSVFFRFSISIEPKGGSVVKRDHPENPSKCQVPCHSRSRSVMLINSTFHRFFALPDPRTIVPPSREPSRPIQRTRIILSALRHQNHYLELNITSLKLDTPTKIFQARFHYFSQISSYLPGLNWILSWTTNKTNSCFRSSPHIHRHGPCFSSFNLTLKPTAVLLHFDI